MVHTNKLGNMATPFHLNNGQVRQTINFTVNNQLLPAEPNPKYLEMTLNRSRLIQKKRNENQKQFNQKTWWSLRGLCQSSPHFSGPQKSIT